MDAAAKTFDASCAGDNAAAVASAECIVLELRVTSAQLAYDTARKAFVDSTSPVLALKTGLRPLLVAVSPQQPVFADAKIVLGFSGPVSRGPASGSGKTRDYGITLLPGGREAAASGGGQPAQAIHVLMNSTAVSIAGNTVTVDLASLDVLRWKQDVLVFTVYVGRRALTLAGKDCGAGGCGNEVFFAGGNVHSVVVRSTIASAAVLPADVPAGSQATVQVSFVARVPITVNCSIIVGFPRTTNSGGVIPSAQGFRIPVGDASQFFTSVEPKFTPTFIQGVNSAYSTSVVMQELGGLGAAGVVQPGQTVSFRLANVSFPRFYGRTSPFTVAVLYGTDTFPAGHALAPGTRLINHGPPQFDRSVYDVAFPEMGAQEKDSVLVTVLFAQDPDGLTAQPTQYTLVGGNELGLFRLNATTGVLVTRSHIDYEALASTVFDLLVNATDGSAPYHSTQARVQVTVSDANDNIPVFVFPHPNRSFYTSLLHEDTSPIKTSVVVLNATDRDTGANGAVTYSLGEGPGADRFKVNAATGEIVVANTVDSFKYHNVLLPVVATDKGVRNTLSATAWVCIGVINDNDLNYMTVSITGDAGLLDRPFFENAVATALCPLGTCMVQVYNSSKASRRRSSATQVTFVVSKTPRMPTPKWDLIPPLNVSQMLARAATTESLSSHAAKFVVIYAGAPTTKTPAAADNTYLGLTLLELVWVCVGSVLFLLLCCILVFCCVGGRRHEGKTQVHVSGWDLKGGGDTVNYYDPVPFAREDNFNFHVGRTATPLHTKTPFGQPQPPFSVTQSAAHFHPPENDWSFAEHALQSHAGSFPQPDLLHGTRVDTAPADWAAAATALGAASYTDSPQHQHQQNQRNQQHQHQQHQHQQYQQHQHQQRYAASPTRSTSSSPGRPVAYAAIDFDRTGQYRLPDNNSSSLLTPARAYTPGHYHPGSSQTTPQSPGHHHPHPWQTSPQALHSYADNGTTGFQSGYQMVDPMEVLLESDRAYMGQNFGNPLNDPLFQSMENGALWGDTRRGSMPQSPMGMDDDYIGVMSDDYIGVTNPNDPMAVRLQLYCTAFFLNIFIYLFCRLHLWVPASQASPAVSWAKCLSVTVSVVCTDCSEPGARGSDVQLLDRVTPSLVSLCEFGRVPGQASASLGPSTHSPCLGLRFKSLQNKSFALKLSFSSP